jgi:subtilisin family serine protease
MFSSPMKRFASGVAFLSIFTLASSTWAAPRVEKKVRAQLLMAEDENEKISVIVEGDSMEGIRDLLGANAEHDLRLINAVSGNVPASKLRDLLNSDQVRAVYANEKVALVKPVNEDATRPNSFINMPMVEDVLAAEEQQAGVTYGIRLIQAREAVKFVRQWRKLVKERTGQELPEIRVGIVDTGIDGHHEAFKKPGLIYDWSDLSSDFSPEPRDDNGHGSHVAGTIAGTTSPDGIQFGIIPQDMTRLAIARGLNPYGTDAWLISALAWMADPDGDPSTKDGVSVINNSWGSSRRGDLYARVIKGLQDEGILCIFAAGNSGPGPATVGSPGHLPNVLTVGAVDHNRRITSFSSRGDPIVNKVSIWIKPDVCAPGNAVLSIGPENTFQRWPGTSMASPHVTAVAALVRMVNPNLSPRDVKLLIESTATDLGPSGKDESYGSGLVNALAAVQKAAEMFGKGQGMTPDQDPDALMVQAKEYMRVRKTQYAVENLFKVINNFPDLPLDKRVEAGYLMGEAFRELGNYQGAVASYKGIPMLDPNSPFAPKAKYWIAWCFAHAAGENFIPHIRRGIKLFQAFMSEYPGHDWVQLAGLEMGKGYIALQRPEDAKAILLKVLELRPNSEHRLNIQRMLQSLASDEDLLDF